jgi:nucleoid-associated protein YgaU
MAHEAKLGLIFVGILLTVFGALLLKKLSKHGVPPTSLNASTMKSGDGALSRVPPQPSPPTLVKPLNENTKPPEFAVETHDAPKASDETTWNSTRSRSNTDSSSRDSKPIAAAPPSLLSEPIPVAEAGDRYKTALPYRSSYPTASDDSRATPLVTARQEETMPPVNPFPHVNTPETPTASDRIATSVEPPAPYRASDSTASSSSQGAGNQFTNSLRATPPPRSTTAFTSATQEPNNERYATRPPSVSQSQPVVSQSPPVMTPQPAYNFAPRNPMASDFTSPNSSSGVMTASAPPAAMQRNGDQYAVQPNDNFWTISEKAYGVGGYFKALYELNRKRTKDSEDLKVGEVLTVPDEAIIRRMYPDLCPKPRKMTASTQQRMVSASTRLQNGGRIYTVADGDTLFEIARHELGRPSRWAEIYDLNRDVLGDDFDYLRTGTELILPQSVAPQPNSPRNNTATRQPDAVYPR